MVVAAVSRGQKCCWVARTRRDLLPCSCWCKLPGPKGCVVRLGGNVLLPSLEAKVWPSHLECEGGTMAYRRGRYARHGCMAVLVRLSSVCAMDLAAAVGVAGVQCFALLEFKQARSGKGWCYLWAT